jgi:hypothetical protein
MTRVLVALFAATWLLASTPVLPHHSFAAEFDLNRPVELTGTVSRIQWTNPHAWIHVDVEADNGSIQTWAIELLGINTLVRRGWTRETVQPGEVISVIGYGARDGSTAANATTVTRTDSGEMLWDSRAQ